MISTQYNTNMARAFMAAEMFMAAANRAASSAARVRAEKLLDDYFTLIDQAIPVTENNPLDRRLIRATRIVNQNRLSKHFNNLIPPPCAI